MSIRASNVSRELADVLGHTQEIVNSLVVQLGCLAATQMGKDVKSFGHFVQSKERAVVFVILPGCSIDDTAEIRNILAVRNIHCEFALVTIGVGLGKQGGSHIAFAPISMSDPLVVMGAGPQCLPNGLTFRIKVGESTVFSQPPSTVFSQPPLAERVLICPNREKSSPMEKSRPMDLKQSGESDSLQPFGIQPASVQPDDCVVIRQKNSSWKNELVDSKKREYH